jgi:hypothetical protein
MPLARLAQYQHCLLRRNGVRTTWNSPCPESSVAEQIALLRLSWQAGDIDILAKVSAADHSS